MKHIRTSQLAPIALTVLFIFSACGTIIEQKNLSTIIKNARDTEAREIARHRQAIAYIESIRNNTSESELALAMAIHRSEVTGRMATDAVGYTLGRAIEGQDIAPSQRAELLTILARKYGLQNWIVTAATICDVDLNQIKQVASQSGKEPSPFVRKEYL